MAVLHISEAEAIRDPAALFGHIRAGFEVVIEGEGESVARLVATKPDHADDPEYDAWFMAQVDHALDDPRESIDSEAVEAHFAQRRRASALRLLDMAG